MSLHPSDSSTRLAQDIAVVGRLAVVPRILHAMADLTGLRFVAIARVTDSTWTCCAVRDQLGFGLAPGGQLELETTLCNEIRQSRRPIVFGHASADPVYAGHPTPRLYQFESYISLPIVRADGTFFGTLCALDRDPIAVGDAASMRTLELFAQLIASQLDLEERLSTSQTQLAHEQQQAVFREQFVAVLGHDLRSPLQAIRMGAYGLTKLPLPDIANNALRLIVRATERMAELITNILDFARGRLGSGIPVVLRDDAQLGEALRAVIAEFETSHPGRLVSAIDLTVPVVCDRDRLGQLLANLIGNALAHGDPVAPVLIEARSGDTGFVLAVENRGTPIAADVQARLFEPFYRAGGDATSAGLGLGLFIAAEIARSHAGRLTVDSHGERTRFVFALPGRASQQSSAERSD